MSNFKIQIFNQSSQLQIKKIQLPKIPQININIQSMSLLNYPLDQLLEIVQQFFVQNYTGKLHLIKSLKVLTHSLGDNKLLSKFQSILSSKIKNQSKIYDFFILWSSIYKHISKIIIRFNDNLKKSVLNIIFSHFFLQKNAQEEYIKPQLGQLLKIQKKQILINHLKLKYKQNKEPLHLCILKCMKIKTQIIQILNFLRQWLQFCINTSQNQLISLIKDNNTKQLLYLIDNITNINIILTKQLKTIITQQNIRSFTTLNPKINVIYHSAIKQWINQTNNYWKIVNKYMNNDNNQYINQTIQLGKQINQQNIQNECMIIKCLYNYMQGNRFDFQIQDNKFMQYQKQSWMDSYRAITMCNSYKNMNLIIININSSIKWWNPTNPFKNNSKIDKLNKFIDHHHDFYQQKQKQYGLKNKKIQIVYNTFLIQNKQTKKQYWLTYEQLLQYIDNKLDINLMTFKKIYNPYKIQIKQYKQQSKKQHNIIIEAKLVKLLKKHKESLTFQFMSKESGYSIEIVQLGIKRLVSKGLAQQDQKKKGYNYIP